MLGRQFAAVVQAAGLGNEVWGDSYLMILRGLAKWTLQEGLSYKFASWGRLCYGHNPIMLYIYFSFLFFFSGTAFYAELLVMGHRCCCILINKRSPLLSMN